MAQLKDLLVSGNAKILGKIHSPKFVGDLQGNADSATKATNDSLNKNIATTYALVNGFSFTTESNVGYFNAKANSNVAFKIPLPVAGANPGIITGGDQTLYGNKTFYNNVNFTQHKAGITWNRVTDGASIIFDADTDSTDNYLTFNVTDDEPVNFKWTKTAGSTTTTLGTWKREGIRLGTGKFIGDLDGNAKTATNATNDSAGVSITSYLKNATISGKTITITRGDGTYYTLTTQDTWRGIQNNLASDSATDSLSAAQGKVLKGLVDKRLERIEWTASIKCSTWSRLCYVVQKGSVIGSSYILNIVATRNSVVYHDTFFIKTHHNQSAVITKLSGSKYSSGLKIRVLADAGGTSYIDFYDSVNGATNATVQRVYCTLLKIYTGDVTTYTDFTDGSSIPANYKAAAELTTTFNSLQGNLDWTEITGKPTTFTPSSHTHDDKYLKLTGGTLTGLLNIKASNLSTSYNENIRLHPDDSLGWSSIIFCGTDNKGDSGTSANTWSICTKGGNFAIAKYGNGLNEGSDTAKLTCIVNTATNKPEWKIDGSIILNASNYNDYAPTKIGTGASGTWGISISGNAASASKLTTSAGSDDTPVYFSNGVPKACTKSMYEHPVSTVTAGTYRSVTVDKYGHVTAGTNPNTLAGYGITDAAAKNHTHTKSQITDFPASLKNPNSLILRLNGGTTEGTNQFTYDGSAAKTVSITPANIGALSLNGGTVNGVTDFTYGTGIKAFGSSTSATGYLLLANIVIKRNYINSPIELVFTRRSDYVPTRMNIIFSSVDSMDPGIASFNSWGGGVQGILVKAATSTWNLYIPKTEGWDKIDVTEFHIPKYVQSGITWTWKGDTVVSSAPSGTTSTRGGQAYAASIAAKLQTACSINGTNFDGTANITTSKWGYGRTFQIKDSATTYVSDSVTVDGSAAVVLKMPAHGKFVSGLDIGNGTSAGSTINFYPASTSSIGCKIVAYSDRIEFVF